MRPTTKQHFVKPGHVDPADGILKTIGNTPLVRFSKLFPDMDVEIFGKLEAFNPGGSMKDRPALRMLTRALESGAITQNTTIIESSSGNLAIGLAQACGALGIKLIVVVDPKATATNLKIVKAYGAEIDMVTEPDPETGEFLSARRKRIQSLLASVPNSFNLNQYANPDNGRSHQLGTAREIIEALNGDFDYLFVAVSTCGTLLGSRDAIVDAGCRAQIVAVDAEGSVIFGTPGPRLLPGHGAGVVPENMRPDLADQAVLVSDSDCVAGCRTAAAREAVLLGASSGGVLSAIWKMRAQFSKGTRIAAILADRGERYLDTVYDDAWCCNQFGTVPTLDIENQVELYQQGSVAAR